MNAWVHTCITYNGTTFSQYKDGVLQHTSMTDSGELVTTSNSLFIGRADDNVATHESFYGYIDDVRIYNRGIHPDQVQEIYCDEAHNHGHEPMCTTSTTMTMTTEA